MICPNCGKEVPDKLPICGNCGEAVRGTVPVIAEAIKRATANTETEWLKNEKQSLDALRAPDESTKSIVQADYKRLEKKIKDSSVDGAAGGWTE
jgi:hypothetical protein